MKVGINSKYLIAPPKFAKFDSNMLSVILASVFFKKIDPPDKLA